MARLARLALLATFLFCTAPALAAVSPSTNSAPPDYKLVMEFSPAAPFAFLSRFGTADITVVKSGVAAKGMLLRAYSRNGSKNVTLAHSVSRMYADVPVQELRAILLKMSGRSGEIMPGLHEFPIDPKVASGNVRGIPAKRYRVILGPTASIDVWTTTVVPPNPQFRLLAKQFVTTVSEPAANLVEKIPGTPIFVEMNTRRFKKLVLLRVKSLSRGAIDEDAELSTGSFYVKVPFVEKLLAN